VAVLILTERVAEAQAALDAAGLGDSGSVEPDLTRAMERLEREPWDLVVIDAGLAAGAGLELIEPIAVEGGRVVVTAAQPSLAVTLRVLRSGALDVLPFPPPSARLRELAADAAGAGTGAQFDDVSDASGWIGASPVLLDAFRSALRLAGSEVPIFLWGEAGTGKERLARIIHGASGRSEGPWLPVNCGAIPESVLESELFGHEAGGAPGVFGRRIGRFVRAAGGTLMLDEIENLSPRMQHRVAQAVETRRIEPRGATQEIEVDVRLIAAAERDPRQLRQESVLTKDLYAALSPGLIHLPPLRERGEEDVRALAQQFASEFSKRHGRVVHTIADDAWEALLRHPWPGNVRQLRGAIERGVLEAEAGVLHVRHLPAEVVRTAERLPSEASLRLEDIEKRHIMKVMELTENHVGRAAGLLGIHRNTLSRKLRGYGIELE
jgi:DNA-binding NtrC family response regulator